MERIKFRTCEIVVAERLANVLNLSGAKFRLEAVINPRCMIYVFSIEPTKELVRNYKLLEVLNKQINNKMTEQVKEEIEILKSDLNQLRKSVKRSEKKIEKHQLRIEVDRQIIEEYENRILQYVTND